MKKELYISIICFITYFVINYSIITNHNLQVDNTLNKVSYGEILDQAGTTTVWKQQKVKGEYYNIEMLLTGSVMVVICLLEFAVLIILKKASEFLVTTLAFIILIVTILFTIASYDKSKYQQKISEELTKEMQNKQLVINYILTQPQPKYDITNYNNNKDFEVTVIKPAIYQNEPLTVMGTTTIAKKVIEPEISVKLNTKEIIAINNFNKAKGIATTTK